MPITLADSKVGLADHVDQKVVDEFRRDSFILDRLKFDNSVSPGTGGSTLTYGYLQLKTPSLAEGRKLNSEYQAGEAIKTQKTVNLKIFGGAFEVDRVLEKTAASSEISFQLTEKIKAVKNKFHYDFINGKSTAKGNAGTDNTPFDGLDVLVTGTNTEEKNAAAPFDMSSAAKIKENANEFMYALDTWLSKLSEKPDALLVNRKTATMLKTVAKMQGYYDRTKNDFGQKVEYYDEIAIVDMGEYFDGTSTKMCVPIDAKTGTTSIYAVKLGLNAVHAVSPKGDKIISTYLPDLSNPGAVKKGEVEMVAAIVSKDTTKAGVFRNVQVAPVA
nr:MAG TPA: major capsid protein [Caudoviricetes sp.]